MTNFEKIKAMTIEEMAKTIDNAYNKNSCEVCCIYNGNCTTNTTCTVGIKHWLESEVEE